MISFVQNIDFLTSLMIIFSNSTLGRCCTKKQEHSEGISSDEFRRAITSLATGARSHPTTGSLEAFEAKKVDIPIR